MIELGIKVGKTTAVSLGRRNSSHRFGQRTKGASVVVTADAEEMLQSYEWDGMEISVWTDSICRALVFAVLISNRTSNERRFQFNDMW